MQVFGNDANVRGCFTVFTFDASRGRGMVLKLPTGQQIPKADYSDPIVLTGFEYTQREKAYMVSCFQERVYTYAFGHNPNESTLTANFIGFLRQGGIYKVPGGGGGGGVKDQSRVVEDYNQNYQAGRVTRAKKYAYLHYGSSQMLKGFIVGMNSNTRDEQYSLQSFSMNLALVEAQGII